MLMTEKMQIELENLEALLQEDSLSSEYKLEIIAKSIDNMLHRR